MLLHLVARLRLARSVAPLMELESGKTLLFAH